MSWFINSNELKTESRPTKLSEEVQESKQESVRKKLPSSSRQMVQETKEVRFRCSKKVSELLDFESSRLKTVLL